MAKKTRTPPPPRKVQAPRQRTTKREVSSKQRNYLFIVLAAMGLGAIIVVVSVLASRRGGGATDQGVVGTLRAGGCTYKVYPASSQQHVGNLNAKVKYNSFPPSNGSHFGQPAVFGNFADPVQQVQAVHNLEHGAMLIEYGNGVSRANIDAITAFYDKSPNGMLVFPYGPLKKKIALVAWTADTTKLQTRSDRGGYHGEGRVALCNAFNEKAFKVFQDRFRAKGPERFPLDAMPPGA